MSMTVSRLPDALLTSNTSPSVKVRVVGDHPDLLSRAYRQLRRLPAVVAFLICWSSARHHPFTSFDDVVKLTLSVRHVLLIVVLICIADRPFRLRSNTCRSAARWSFVLSQSLAVFWGTLLCAAVMAVGEYVLLIDGIQSLSIPLFTGFFLLSGVTVVLLAAISYEIAYQLSGTSMYLIVGSQSRAIDAFDRLETHGGRRGAVLGFVDTDECGRAGLPAPYLGSLEKLEHILATNPVDMVYLTLPLQSHYGNVQEAIKVCERLGVRYCCSPNIFETSVEHQHLIMRDVQQAVHGHEDARLSVKRAADLVGAAILLVILAPLLVLIGLAIKATSPGPALFVQERYGTNRRKFKMYKFRSMVVDAEHRMASLEHANELAGPIFKVRRDPRITPLGMWLRKLSLDELPQLFNVLKGNMSLVGPRPMSTRDVHRFSQASLMRRFSVTPGITGLWQVSGRSNLSFDSWIKLDMEYIDKWTLSLDLIILVRTIRAVFLCEGAH